MDRQNNFISDHIYKYPFGFMGVLFVGFINSCVSFLLPVSIGEFFAFHFHTGSSKGKLLAWMGLHINTMLQFLLLFVLLLIAKAITGYIGVLGTYKQGELFVKGIRESIFAAQMNWEPSGLPKGSYGKYLLRYSNDMKSLQNYYTKGVIGGIKNLIFLFAGLFLLSRINLILAIILFLLLIISATLIYFIARYQKSFIRSSRNQRSSLLSFVAKSLVGFERLKQRQAEAATIENFERRSENLYSTNMQSNKIETLLQNLTPLLIYTMIGILLWQMTMHYVTISASDGLMIILMVLMMQGAMRKTLKIPGYLNKGKISLLKINKILQPQTINTDSFESI